MLTCAEQSLCPALTALRSERSLHHTLCPFHSIPDAATAQDASAVAPLQWCISSPDHKFCACSIVHLCTVVSPAAAASLSTEISHLKMHAAGLHFPGGGPPMGRPPMMPMMSGAPMPPFMPLYMPGPGFPMGFPPGGMMPMPMQPGMGPHAPLPFSGFTPPLGGAWDPL